jgi:hypothetical protein
LEPATTPDQIARITVNSKEHEFRVMGDALMVTPSIGHKFRAEQVEIFLKSEETPLDPPPAPHQYRDSQPDLSMGLGRKPHNSYLRRDR